jgi:hypothetical protein
MPGGGKWRHDLYDADAQAAAADTAHAGNGGEEMAE